MPAPAPDISLVVPCFDEEASLPRLFGELERLLGLAADRGLRVQVILVDDGSGDGTPRLLAGWAAAGEGREVLTHRENRGFGAAMRTGFAASRGEAVVCYDADACYPVEDVLRLTTALAGADVAAASPFAPGGEARVPRLRSLLSRGAARLYALALRDRSGGLTAYTCAFRAYRRSAIRGIAWRAEGFLAAAEVMARLLLSSRARVREVSSRLRAREAGRSRMRVVRVAAGHLALLAGIALRRPPFAPAARGRS